MMLYVVVVSIITHIQGKLLFLFRSTNSSVGEAADYDSLVVVVVNLSMKHLLAGVD